MKHHRIWPLGALLALALAAPAAASPVTVNLRVEATTGTLFEGPITTDAKSAISTPSSGGPHHCDGTNGGANPSPGGTMTTALDDASLTGAFSWDGTYDTTYDDFFITTIGPDTGTANNFWGLFLNWQYAPAGGCQVEVHPGDQVLFAYVGMTDGLLELQGPSSVATGQPYTVAVLAHDGSGHTTPAAGASVGGATTDANGNATLTFSSPGEQHLKAIKSGDARSNGLNVCVYAPGSGQCSTSVPPVAADKLPPNVSIAGIRNGARFRRGHGPRKLSGTASDSGGLFQVYFRLRRHTSTGCQWYSSKRSVFTRPRAHCAARFQRVGTNGKWSYLLPQRLPAGRYTLEEKALDVAFNRALARVTFTVLG
jgi:hypothetical protein